MLVIMVYTYQMGRGMMSSVDHPGRSDVVQRMQHGNAHHGKLPNDNENEKIHDSEQNEVEEEEEEVGGKIMADAGKPLAALRPRDDADALIEPPVAAQEHKDDVKEHTSKDDVKEHTKDDVKEHTSKDDVKERTLRPRDDADALPKTRRIEPPVAAQEHKDDVKEHTSKDDVNEHKDEVKKHEDDIQAQRIKTDKIAVKHEQIIESGKKDKASNISSSHKDKKPENEFHQDDEKPKADKPEVREKLSESEEKEIIRRGGSNQRRPRRPRRQDQDNVVNAALNEAHAEGNDQEEAMEKIVFDLDVLAKNIGKYSFCAVFIYRNGMHTRTEGSV